MLRDDHLAAEVGPKGRLTALLAAADADDVSFAVDPALLDELATMRAGYQVLDRRGRADPGTGQTAASGWLTGSTT